MAINSYRKDYKTALSANFKVNEFSCHGKGCCSKTMVDSRLVDYLQKIREHFDAPITINSGFRCATHNKSVGGANGSYHTKGMAADIVVEGVKPAEVAKYAESIGVLGIGLYEKDRDGYFVHIDTRTSKAFWYGQTQVKRTTFGGAVTKSKSAVKAWQLAAIADGYKFASGADGIWGKECEAVAKKAICKRCYWPWKNKNLTKIIQGAVGVNADGKFGAGTKSAVIKMQKLFGITADGVVGYNTWKKMLGV